jgi:membrane associated rhomboid family serine protease
MFPIHDENEPGHGLAWVTLAILAINVIVFVVFQAPDADQSFTYAFSAVPLEITTGVDIARPVAIDVGGQQVVIDHQPGPSPIYLTLLSSMFMHGGWLHLGGNMLFLFIFGDNIEHRIGRLPFLVFYLVSGLVASLAQIAIDPDSIIPTLGASGAISGVLGAYLVMFPGNRVTVFLFRFLMPVPAIVAIGIWAVFQFVNGFGALAATEEMVGGVAYAAHIGGFVAGVVCGLVFRGMGGGGRRRVAYG